MEILTNDAWLQRFEAYLKRRFPDRSTAKHYLSDLRLFVQHHPDPLCRVGVRDIDAFVDQQHTLNRSLATVQRRVATLRTFFNFMAEEMEQPERPNPVSMRRHAGRPAQHLPRDLSDEEVQRLLAKVQEPRDQAMIDLMLYAGLRVGEVVSLHPADITIPTDPQAAVRLRVMGKGRKERVTYLWREQYQALAQYRQQHPLAAPQASLFHNRLGRSINVAGVQERVAHYAKISGVALTCHSLRHTYGRWMAEAEMPVLTLSRLMGHSSLQVTQRYIDGADPQVRRNYEAAMARAQSRPPEAATTGADLLPTLARSGTATVIRTVPRDLAVPAWLSDWPAWLREACLDWLKRQWPTWKPSQRQHHAQNRWRELHLFWKWQLARRPMTAWAELTAQDVAAFVEAQLARDLAPETVSRHVTTLYAVLYDLQARGQLATVPRRPEVALPDPLPQHLSPQEIITLETQMAQRAQTAQGQGWLDLALYYLLAHAGLRISEALDLQAQDLELAARRVRIRDGKERKDRVVYLTQQAATVVHCYLATVPHAAEDLVLSEHGRPLSYDQAAGRIHNLGEAVGITDLCPRRLRHTYATLLLNNGMKIEGWQKLMGHEHLDTTLIYARLADRTAEQQYEAAMKRIVNICQPNVT